MSVFGRNRRRCSRSPTLSGDATVAYDEVVTVFALFHGSDLVGEFDTRDEAERALDEAVAADGSAAGELAVFEFAESGERVGEPITRAEA